MFNSPLRLLPDVPQPAKVLFVHTSEESDRHTFEVDALRGAAAPAR